MDIARLLVEASKAAREECDAWYLASDANSHIRHVARALCEKAGHDPDIVVMGRERQPLAVGAKGVAALQLPIHPQWVLFVQDARNAIEVLENAETQAS